MKADLILESNLIFDSISDETFEGFIAIKGEKILAVSKSSNEKELYTNEKTVTLSYTDKLIMPSFFDSHVHLILAGMFKTFIDLGECKSEEESAKFCYEYYKNNPTDGWLIGFNWYNFRWDDQSLPSKKSLDKYFKDIPVILLNSEAHNAWVNTKALEICGIDKNTKDPFGGEIKRDENGDATGFIFESAIALFTPFAFNFSATKQKEFIKNFQKSSLALGITSVVDVKPYFGCDLGSFDILSELEDSDELHLRVHCASSLFGDMDLALENSKKYNSDKIRANFLKEFIDGVIPTYTALMIDDYSDNPGNKGYALNELSLFENSITKAHKRGLSVKIHAIGDLAIEFTLDCFEKAQLKYGKTSSRHAIEHCEYVADKDFARFGKLGVIPSVQPEHIGLSPTWEHEPYRQVLGEMRANNTWSFKKLLNSAGVIALGSDCPVVDNNPFLGIHRGFTRLHDDLLPEGGWNPTQKLTIAELLKGYTIGSAYGANRENDIGTLETGKFADIAVIDTDLFSAKPTEIRNACVLTTIMNGKIVYTK